MQVLCALKILPIIQLLKENAENNCAKAHFGYTIYCISNVLTDVNVLTEVMAVAVMCCDDRIKPKLRHKNVSQLVVI